MPESEFIADKVNEFREEEEKDKENSNPNVQFFKDKAPAVISQEQPKGKRITLSSIIAGNDITSDKMINEIKNKASSIAERRKQKVPRKLLGKNIPKSKQKENDENEHDRNAETVEMMQDITEEPSQK